jgi:hypothetical protein
LFFEKILKENSGWNIVSVNDCGHITVGGSDPASFNVDGLDAISGIREVSKKICGI